MNCGRMGGNHYKNNKVQEKKKFIKVEIKPKKITSPKQDKGNGVKSPQRYYAARYVTAPRRAMRLVAALMTVAPLGLGGLVLPLAPFEVEGEGGVLVVTAGGTMVAAGPEVLSGMLAEELAALMLNSLDWA